MYCATAFKEICLYLQDNLIFLDLLDKVDEDLFYNMCRALYFFTSLPIYRSGCRSLNNLRDRGHTFHLPDYSTNVYKMFFVARSLYKFI